MVEKVRQREREREREREKEKEREIRLKTLVRIFDISILWTIVRKK